MNHYTYQITKVSLQKHYIGVKSCEEEPKNNIGVKYFSSSADDNFMTQQKENPNDFSYIVLREFNTRAEAVAHEIYLHKINDVAKNPKFFNKSRQTSTGFDTTGLPKEEHYAFGKVYITDGSMFKRAFIDEIPNGWYVGGPAVGKGYKKFKRTDNTFTTCLPEDAHKDWEMVNPPKSHTIISNGKGYKMYQKPDGSYTKRLPKDALADWVEQFPSIGNNHQWFQKPNGARTHCLSQDAENDWVEDKLRTGIGFKSYQKPDGTFTSCLPINAQSDWILKGRTKGKVYYRYQLPDGTFVNRLEKNAKKEWIKVQKGSN